MRPHNLKRHTLKNGILQLVLGIIFLTTFFLPSALSYASHTTETLIFYDGDLIRAEGDSKVYVLSPGKRRWIRSLEVFNSYNFKWENVRVVPPIALSVFEFTNLIRQVGDEKVYLINESGFKRHIPSPQVFESYSFKWEDVAVVPSIEVRSYPESRLIREEGDTKVYFIENNTKRWVETAEVFNSQGFDWNEVRVVNTTESTFFQEGEVITPQAPKIEVPVTVTEEPEKEEVTEPVSETTEPTSATTTEPISETTPEPIATVPVPIPSGGGGSPVSSSTDTTPPAAVTDLSASNITTSSVTLSWTAPGDDGNSGTATNYVVRYSTTPLVGLFVTATEVEGDPTPGPSGTVQSMTVSRLSAGTTYYFAIKTSDEAPNLSEVSNIITLSTVSAPDTITPGTITNLVASNPTASSVTLSWTASGDDGSVGTATNYDVIYHNETTIYSVAYYDVTTITRTNWRKAVQAIGESSPKTSGSSETFTVTGLSAGTPYFFAIRASDEAPNWSELSNVVSLTTTADTTAPSNITSLTASNPTASSLDLSWTAPGDDGSTGTATSYDVRYSTSNITDANWASATQVTGEPAPQVAGSAESTVVSGLSAGTIYYFAVKSSDEVGNESGISNIASKTTVACATSDSGSQIYNVTSGPGQPQIQKVVINPVDYTVGSSQTITVTARDTNSNAITSMNATFITDNGQSAIPLSLSSGSNTSGSWSATWTPTDTRCGGYNIEVTATSASGTPTATLSL